MGTSKKDEAAAADAAAEQEIAEISAELAGVPLSAPARPADRPITDHDIEQHVPPHVAENYAGVVAGRYGGDWTALADQFERDGDAEDDAGRTAHVRGHRVLAAWARRQAAAADVAAKTTPPAGRTGKARSTT